MKLKTIASLLTITLLVSFVSANLPIAEAQATVVTFLTIWTEPKEKAYWESVMAAYEKEKGYTVDVQMIAVEMDVIFDEIVYRYNSHTDTDIISMHCMWLPQFAHWATALVTPAPGDVAADVQANFTAAAKDAVTYKGIIYGYPTEYNTWALVYNKYLIKWEIADRTRKGDTGNAAFLQSVLNQLQARPYQPLSWTQLRQAARLVTRWAGSTINKTGFEPMVGGYEEDRYQFTSLLWSNGGKFLNLSTPAALFNDVHGQEVEDLIYYDLGYREPRAYDPTNLPGLDWDAWLPENQQVVFAILPTWYTYIRDAMGMDLFNTNLGMAPIPIGPHGTESRSITWDWMFAVTERSAHKDAAWDFLKWLNRARPAGYLPKGTNTVPGSEPGKMPPQFGYVPKGNNCSIIGDWLILDSIIPSRTDDQKYGMTTIYEEPDKGRPGTLLSQDWWFSNMTAIANTYGIPDKAFETSQEVQKEVGLSFERVIVTGANPVVELTSCERLVNAALPVPGDLNLDKRVNIVDADFLTYDIWSVARDPPLTPGRWNRGRSDINDDGIVDSTDAGAIVTKWMG